MLRTDATKKLIADSLRELASNKPVDKITIKEITGNCGVSATTFYNHFSNKQELIAWIYNSQTQVIYEEFSKGKISWKDALQQVATTLLRDRTFYIHCFMHTDGPDALFPATSQAAIDLISGLVNTDDAGRPNGELRYAIAVYTHGISHAMSNWLINDPDLPPETLADYLSNAVPDALKEYLWDSGAAL